MRKIFAITTLFFFSLFLKNENAICKTNCKINSECPNHSSVKTPVFSSDANTDIQLSNEPKQYDGFFFKI